MSQASVAAVCANYLDAWARRDVDGILALHHPDSTFRLHAIGEEEAAGSAAVRTAFDAVFQTWPDLSFSTVRLQYGDDFFVHEMDVRGTSLELTDPAGARRTSAEPVHYDMVDVIQIRDGLVYRKDTYVDALAIMFATKELGGART